MKNTVTIAPDVRKTLLDENEELLRQLTRALCLLNEARADAKVFRGASIWFAGGVVVLLIGHILRSAI